MKFISVVLTLAVFLSASGVCFAAGVTFTKDGDKITTIVTDGVAQSVYDMKTGEYRILADIFTPGSVSKPGDQDYAWRMHRLADFHVRHDSPFAGELKAVANKAIALLPHKYELPLSYGEIEGNDFNVRCALYVIEGKTQHIMRLERLGARSQIVEALDINTTTGSIKRWSRPNFRLWHATMASWASWLEGISRRPTLTRDVREYLWDLSQKLRDIPDPVPPPKR